jgi:hypothetical protein
MDTNSIARQLKDIEANERDAMASEDFESASCARSEKREKELKILLDAKASSKRKLQSNPFKCGQEQLLFRYDSLILNLELAESSEVAARLNSSKKGAIVHKALLARHTDLWKGLQRSRDIQKLIHKDELLKGRPSRS